MGRHTSLSGNTLKHSTGLIKIKYMHMVMDFKADLKEKQAAEYQRRIEERLRSLMWELRELDLAWEVWFDNDNNVPDVSHAQIIPYIERRIASLKIPQPLELRREPLSVSCSGDESPSFTVADVFHASATQGAEQ